MYSETKNNNKHNILCLLFDKKCVWVYNDINLKKGGINLSEHCNLQICEQNIENQKETDQLVVEQWKTCVEMANSNSEKRSNTNSIFITINTALIAILPFSLGTKGVVLSAVGIVICILWIRTINNYKKLSSVKYSIINEIEKQLPIAPFSAEWNRLKNEENYTDLTKTERVLPVVFIILFFLSILIPVVKKIIEIVTECT